MAAYVYELARDTWHGFTRTKGEPISLISTENRDILDDHGCGNFWVIDSAGLKMNVWTCEIAMKGWNN